MELDEYSYTRKDVAAAVPTYAQILSDVRSVREGQSENVCGVIVTHHRFTQTPFWREWHVATRVPRAVESADDAASEILNHLLAERAGR